MKNHKNHKKEQKQEKEKIVLYKLLYTMLILLLYLVGRKIPLYGIDTTAYVDMSQDAQSLLMQMIGGDANRYSIFALGISPYITASILLQVYSTYRSRSPKGRLEVGKINKLTVGLSLFFAFGQGISHLEELIFGVSEEKMLLTSAIAVLEMVAGVMIVLWISARNQQYGIGGRTAIIYVNIVDGLLTTLKGQSIQALMIPIAVSVAVVFVMEIVDNTELRLPLQRISIYHIHADKDYLPIKLNPVGVMPVMYASAVFSLVGSMAQAVGNIFPNWDNMQWVLDNLQLSRPLGIGVYLFIICFLSIVLSGVFLNLDEVAETLQKNGDSILDIHAGKDTKKYLSGRLRTISIYSAVVMCLCVGVPMILQVMGQIDGALVMFPVSVMMMVGMWNQLYREIDALRCIENYQMFL